MFAQRLPVIANHDEAQPDGVKNRQPEQENPKSVWFGRTHAGDRSISIEGQVQRFRHFLPAGDPVIDVRQGRGLTINQRGQA